MNGKCAKRIRAAHLKSLNSGSSLGYKVMKRQYRRYPYHKRYQSLVLMLGAVPFNWPPGRVPGHSEQLVANITHLPSWRIRRVKGPHCVVCNDTKEVPGGRDYCRMCP